MGVASGGAIGTDRSPGVALERYSDAVFVRDNDPLYFGNDGDTSIQYNTTNGKTQTAGADIRISDTQKLEFGDGADFTLYSNGSRALATGTLDISDITVYLPAPFLRVDTHICDHSDWRMANSGGASDATAVTIRLSDISIPANSLVLGCQVSISDSFAGSANITSIGMSIGPSANSDAWTGGVSDLNVWQEATRVGALSQSGTPSFTTAATVPVCNLNYVGGVQSDMNGASKGHATVTVSYLKF